MAEFKFKCPFCGQKLSADETWRGERTQCPNCRKEFSIPQKIVPLILDMRKPVGHISLQPGFRSPQRFSPPHCAGDHSKWIISGGIGLAFILLLCLVLSISSAVSGTRSGSSSADYPHYPSGTSLSPDGEVARNFIENVLPSSQRDALLHGTGTFDDRANALTNLMNSGNLDGAIEYLESAR